jgi:NAD(P)-dependent dehydrogenase (short-subunit alcohol dehydrogenase family)
MIYYEIAGSFINLHTMKIFITGSTDGLGLLSAQALIARGHEVVLHARNEQRKNELAQRSTGAKDILTGDLSNIEETKTLADKVNACGTFDAVIHNAGVYRTDAATLFTVNVLAPYLLTALVNRPKRLVYLCSGMHMSGHEHAIKDTTYSDSKYDLLMLCKAVARMWPDVYANAVDPGWVPTKMGGAGAPDDLEKGYETQVWLAESATVSGRYFFHKKEARYHKGVDDVNAQERLLAICKEHTGIDFI